MSIGWNVALNDLIPLLAGLYPDRDKARFAVRKAALDPDEIDFVGTPKIFWMRIVEEANRHDTVQNLITLPKGIFQTSTSLLWNNSYSNPRRRL
jgi:hypothetical protein